MKTTRPYLLALLLAGLLGVWSGAVTLEGRQPFSAQIQQALQILGLYPYGTYATGDVPTWNNTTQQFVASASGSGVISASRFLAGDGTATANSFGFTGEAGLGFYRATTGVIGVGNPNISGTIPYALAPSVFTMGSAVSVGWSSTTIATGTADVTLGRLAADVMAPAAGDAYGLAAKAWIRTAPTISSGFGTTPSIVASNGTAAFTINVGTGGSASTGVIGLPTATTGWRVTCDNTSTNTATVFKTKQTAFTTTTATIGNYDAAGAAAAWVASNVLVCSATAF